MEKKQWLCATCGSVDWEPAKFAKIDQNWSVAESERKERHLSEKKARLSEKKGVLSEKKQQFERKKQDGTKSEKKNKNSETR